MYAAINNQNPGIIETLINAGAEVNARNYGRYNRFDVGCHE
jgi:hypothetical protein